MPLDKRHLERRHKTWHAVLDVPKALAPIVGKGRLVQSLKTHELLEAISRKRPVLAEFSACLDAARRGVQRPVRMIPFDAPSGDLGDAMLARLHHQKAEAAQRVAHRRQDSVAVNDAAERIGAVVESITERSAEIAARKGEGARLAYVAVALGVTTPITSYLDAWFKEHRPLRAKTVDEYRVALSRLDKWLEQEGLGATLEAVDRQTVGRFVSEVLIGVHGLAPASVNKQISGPSSYWRWLLRKGHVQGNPWMEQRLSVARRDDSGTGSETEERPFTDAELLKLLGGKPAPVLGALMRIGALSGMRLGEICALTAGDCAGRFFNVRRAKTKAGIRKVPIHSVLEEEVARLSADKDAAAYLFSDAELGLEKPAPEARGRAMTKRFNTYRRAVGVDEVVEGKRRALTNFHSFRRWFITKAREAGVSRDMVEGAVGHRSQGESFGRYGARPDPEIFRPCVEAVHLPRASPAVPRTTA